MLTPFAFRLAAQSLLHEKWINLLSVLTIAVCFLVMAMTAFAVYNIDLATKKLPEKFSMMVYLKDNLSHEDLKNVVEALRKENVVENVKFIPKDDSIKELRSFLKNTSFVLEGLEENPLPDSVEIKLSKESIALDSVKKIAEKFKGIKGVDEVEYGEQFLTSLNSVKIGIKTLGTAFIIIMFGGILFVCYSTVKILFYRKNREMETFKLLGATKGFIRAPFLIEGATIGFFGGLLSLAGVLIFYYSIILRLSLTIPLFKSIAFPANAVLLLPVLGFVLGITGALIAIGRIRY
jgi:cell division transport system permease protein